MKFIVVKYKVLCCFVLCCLMPFIQGCAGGRSTPFVWQDSSVDLEWPKPPEPPRVRYLRSIHGVEDFKGTSSSGGYFLRWLLGDQKEELPLLSPFALSYGSNGILWVADNGVRSIFRIDLVRKQVDFYREFNGVLLNSPSGIAVDNQSGRVYFSDAALKMVFVLDSDGKYLARIQPEGGFSRPSGLAVDKNGRLLVADAMGGVVYLFDQNGQVVSRFGSKLEDDGYFRRPLNVAFGPNDEILVLDALAFRVEILNSQGEFLGQIGKLGDSAGYLARPKGLAVDNDGYVFISDSAFDNIQLFDLAGNVLMYFGEAGGGHGQFNLPAGLFVSSDGRLFAADSYNHRVQVFQVFQGTK